ncbi:nucleotidyltransferase family protein [Fictibacillus nanhaiensis]|uniref:nucleotidyltransferase family protein n=1 Tax=Fictibacillus nanhaiensis TaxID=742169 RepID=UPI001C9882AA|nr:nucleotidyltransferase family protein [Fictibacillus nanhaiensis]MBY6037650.1 nucleotidyltransferase family protein [Fictibacillus nanhaiensis]
MEIRNKQDVTALIENDQWMMDILKAAQSLNLPDWWICAGFVRSKIWDTLHGFKERTPLGDIDVVYYDRSNMDKTIEKKYDKKLHTCMPNLPWSVKNEARMHIVNGFEPYTSAVDAISKFPETATALGVKLNEEDKVILAAPCGIEDVLNMVVKPTEVFMETEERMKHFRNRLKKKNWMTTWDKVRVIELETIKKA